MKKSISIVILVFLLLVPSAVYAHTGLQSSSPANGTTVSEPLTDIKMVFNTDIGSLSGFEVRGADGTNVKVTDRKVDGSTMTGKLESALTDGEYTVTWKIVGRDGHPVENKFSFTVKQSGQPPAQQTPANSQQTPDADKQATAVPAPEKDSGMVMMMGLVIVIGAILIGAMILIFKMKKGRGRP